VGLLTIRAPSKAKSLLALTMIHPASGWFEIVKATNKSATSTQDFFITPAWHVSRDLNLFSLKIGKGQIQT
jgi:gentisate 1,2-dioxygenase